MRRALGNTFSRFRNSLRRQPRELTAAEAREAQATREVEARAAAREAAEAERNAEAARLRTERLRAGGYNERAEAQDIAIFLVQEAEAARARVTLAAQAVATYDVLISEVRNFYDWRLNGMYNVTDEISGGMPVYRKSWLRGGVTWLKYDLSRRRWELLNDGDSRCLAYFYCTFGVLPDKAPREGGDLYVVDSYTQSYEVQPGVQITKVNNQNREAPPAPAGRRLAEEERLREVRRLAEEERLRIDHNSEAAEEARLLRAQREEEHQHQVEVEERLRIDPIRRAANTTLQIEGARGMEARAINGLYDATPRVHDSMPVYEKQGGSRLFITYSRRYKQWILKKPSDYLSIAFLECDINILPNETPNHWFVGNGAFAVADPNITVTALPNAVEAVEAAEAEAVEALDPEAVVAVAANDEPPSPPRPLEKRGGRRKRTMKRRRKTKRSKSFKNVGYRRK
jgi:hypothetical protein